MYCIRTRLKIFKNLFASQKSIFTFYVEQKLSKLTSIIIFYTGQKLSLNLSFFARKYHFHTEYSIHTHFLLLCES